MDAVVRHRLAGPAAPRRSSSVAVRPGGPTATSTPSCALFEVAARGPRSATRTVRPPASATSWPRLVAQQIPADTLAERGVRGAAVRLLTAHRSKGLEWRLVVVAHVQQDGWPDLRRRSTLLQADRIGATQGTASSSPPVTARELLKEERRLFYVACTRARQRLVVTAVASAEDEGEQPSRFLDELGRDGREGRAAGPRARCRWPAWSASCGAPSPTPRPPRRSGAAAARRLARLARRVGRRAVRWCRRPTRPRGGAPAPRAGRCSRSATADQPVPVSASMLEALMVCPTQWFLTREAGGVARAHQSANLGQLVHALAERVATGEVAARPSTC